MLRNNYAANRVCILDKQRLISSLGYLGLIPFRGSSVMLIGGENDSRVTFETLFIGYSAVILAFLGGSMWGRVLELHDSRKVLAILVFSNLIALLGWISFYVSIAAFKAAVGSLAVGFILMFLAERRYSVLMFAGVNRAYLDLRTTLTALVVILHLLVLVLG